MENRILAGEYILVAQVEQELVARIIVLKRDFKVIENRLLKHPEARAIVKKGHYDMMVNYSSRTGVFRPALDKDRAQSRAHS